MHAETDAKGWCSRFHFFDEGIGQSKLSQIRHAVTESADTGKDELLRRANVVRIGSDPHAVPKPSQCVFKTAKVVHLVIDNRNHDATPFPSSAALFTILLSLME